MTKHVPSIKQQFIRVVMELSFTDVCEQLKTCKKQPHAYNRHLEKNPINYGLKWKFTVWMNKEQKSKIKYLIFNLFEGRVPLFSLLHHPVFGVSSSCQGRLLVHGSINHPSWAWTK